MTTNPNAIIAANIAEPTGTIAVAITESDPPSLFDRGLDSEPPGSSDLPTTTHRTEVRSQCSAPDSLYP